VESVRFASPSGPKGPLYPYLQRTVADEEVTVAAMAVNELGPMLTASEVAEMLHLHVNTVKRLGDRGELPFYRVCKRGDRRFRLDDVMRFLDRNR
jgi:excisionase family DNA binding protein